MKKGMSNMVLALIMIAVFVVIGLSVATNSYASAKRAANLASCNVNLDLDADGLPNSIDYCKCDPEGVAMVAMMDYGSEEGKKCFEYRYVCEKTDGQWKDDSACFPRTTVEDDFVPSCGQVKGVSEQSVHLAKMVRDEDGSPHKYCPTDEDTCRERIKSVCEEKYS